MDKPLQGTTIICLKNADKVIIAGDGLVCDDNIVAENTIKVCNIDNKLIYGWAGTVALIESYQKHVRDVARKHEFILEHMIDDLVDIFDNERAQKLINKGCTASFIFADKNTIYKLTHHYDITQADKFACTGHGSNIAIGATEVYVNQGLDKQNLEEIAKNILEIVAKYDLYTSNKITIESLEIKKPIVLI